MNIYEESLQFHKQLRGKLEVSSRVKITNEKDLSLAYTPGVAEPCREIHKDPSTAYLYTRKWNTVAVISDGTAVLGLGDIGKHFPDTDPQYKGISSMVLLEHCYQLMDKEGYEINNLDSIIMCEAPKMAPHIQKMRENVASKLHCDISQINIKATRGEKLGFVGRQEGMVAQAVVLLRKKGV